MDCIETTQPRANNKFVMLRDITFGRSMESPQTWQEMAITPLQQRATYGQLHTTSISTPCVNTRTTSTDQQERPLPLHFCTRSRRKELCLQKKKVAGGTETHAQGTGGRCLCDTIRQERVVRIFVLYAGEASTCER